METFALLLVMGGLSLLKFFPLMLKAAVRRGWLASIGFVHYRYPVAGAPLHFEKEILPGAIRQVFIFFPQGKSFVYGSVSAVTPDSAREVERISLIREPTAGDPYRPRSSAYRFLDFWPRALRFKGVGNQERKTLVFKLHETYKGTIREEGAGFGPSDSIDIPCAPF